MNTIVKSDAKTVEIGKDKPFVIIGERINPTGRKLLSKEMQEGNFDRIVRDAKAQMEAGAHILDVNVGIPSVDPNTTEPELMIQAVELVQSVVDLPLAIDSSVVSALIAGIKAAKGRPLVNSVTGEEDRMETILPVVAEYDLPVIAITSDERGILFEAKERFDIAKKIVDRAATYGIKPEDVLVDPLAMPVSAVGTAGLDVFSITKMVEEELGCNTVCGASNISFGLPNRGAINSAFLAMAAAAGMTSAITNPLVESLRNAIYAADVLMGKDEMCMNYVTVMRKKIKAAKANK